MSSATLIICADPDERTAAVNGIAAGASVERIESSSAMEELNTRSLLPGKRVILIEGKPPAELTTYLEHPQEEIDLIVAVESATAKSPLRKAFEKHGKVKEIAKIPPWKKEEALVRWVTERAPIRADVALQLVRLVGADRHQLSLELEKLQCFVGEGGMISIDALRQLTVRNSSDVIWDLGRAVMERQPKEAIRLWRSLLRQETIPLAALAQVRTQLQQGLRICSITAKGGDVTAVFPYLRGKLLDKTVATAQSYGPHRFRQALIELHELEVASKMGTLPMNVAVENLLVKLC